MFSGSRHSPCKLNCRVIGRRGSIPWDKFDPDGRCIGNGKRPLRYPVAGHPRDSSLADQQRDAVSLASRHFCVGKIVLELLRSVHAPRVESGLPDAGT